MTKLTVLKFENNNYKPEVTTEIIEQFNPVTLEFDYIEKEIKKPLSDDEIHAAKNDANYRLAEVASNILNKLGCSVILELDVIKFYTDDKGE